MQLEKEIESLLTSSILKSLDSAQHDSHGTCYAKKKPSVQSLSGLRNDPSDSEEFFLSPPSRRRMMNTEQLRQTGSILRQYVGWSNGGSEACQIGIEITQLYVSYVWWSGPFTKCQI